MSKISNNPPCFIPLNYTSQCNKENVLYYNASAAAEDIFECASGRLLAVINLMENLYEFDKGETTAIPAVCAVASLLLNDAVVLLQEMNPVALKLRNAYGKD